MTVCKANPSPPQPSKWLICYHVTLCVTGAGDDLGVINGVCHTANSIFKRYRDQYRNNEMVAELDQSQVRVTAWSSSISNMPMPLPSFSTYNW